MRRFSSVNIVAVTFSKNLLAAQYLVDKVAAFPNTLGDDHPKKPVKW
jgi:hypothetical protein